MFRTSQGIVVFGDTSNTNGMISTDGGQSWKYFNMMIGSSTYGDNLNDLQFINDSVGFYIGANNGIWKTTDGGLEWEYTGGMIKYIYDISQFKMLTENFGVQVVIQNQNQPYGVIYTTTNAGKAWAIARLDSTVNKVSFGVSYDLSHVYNWSYFLDTLHWWVERTITTLLPNTDSTLPNGNFKSITSLLRTSDGGVTWSESFIDSVVFIDPSDAFPSYTQNPPWVQFPLISATFIDSLHGIANANQIDNVFNDTLLSTTDGGLTWSPFARLLPDSFNSILSATATFNLIREIMSINGPDRALNYYMYCVSSDSGKTWLLDTFAMTEPLGNIYSLGPGAFGSFGAYGSVLITTDSCKTWSPQNPFGNNGIGQLFFFDRNNGFALSIG